MKKINLSRVLVTMSVLLFFCAPAMAANVQVEMKLPPEVEVTKFDCSLGASKKMAAEPVTIYDFSVKNISNVPHLFSGVILVPETGQSAGGFIPRKGKPPELKPGEEINLKWAVHMFELPKEKVKLVIETVN